MRDTDDIGSNPSANAHIDEVIGVRPDRRSFLKGGLTAAAAGFFAPAMWADIASASPPAGARLSPARGPLRPGRSRLLGFSEVGTSTDDTFVVPAGYRYQILAPWGMPLFPGVEYRDDGSNTASDQERQVGFNHDGMHFFPLANGPQGNRRGLLVFNNEYTDANMIYPAGVLQGAASPGRVIAGPQDKAKVDKAVAGHGVTIVEIRRNADGSWSEVVPSPYNRRVTGATPVAFSGPVTLDHPALASNNAPMGTLNNCAHGYTPWGTYLACEENWNGYFGTAQPGWTPSAQQARYGVNANGFGYQWHLADSRFDLAQNPNELNRFGWVVEIDPSDPSSTPVKRTALGRIKHEGATVTEGKGRRVVVYSGDDENLDYVYKFVGDGNWVSVRARGRSPLDEGTLYVGRFDPNGTGTWLPLRHGTGPLTVANGWADQADVLLRTREAADAVGATKLHRPEWVSVDPATKDVYLTLTNGSSSQGPRTLDATELPANAGRANDVYGKILRWREAKGDSAALAFTWDIFMLAGDPAYDAAGQPVGGGTPSRTEQPIFGSPDGIWIDPDRRVWIQTDISNSSQNLASRGYDNIANNAMLCADPETGELRRFLVGPRGQEITGVITTPDQRTMFVNVQHPGESTTYWNGLAGAGPSPAEPGKVSNWPTRLNGATGAELADPTVRPRPCTVVIWKDDGGVIGT